jgi:transposase-like protein
MPKRYAREFRRAVCERLVADETVSSLSKEFGVSEAPSISGSAKRLATPGPETDADDAG